MQYYQPYFQIKVVQYFICLNILKIEDNKSLGFIRFLKSEELYLKMSTVFLLSRRFSFLLFTKLFILQHTILKIQLIILVHLLIFPKQVQNIVLRIMIFLKIEKKGLILRPLFSIFRKIIILCTTFCSHSRNQETRTQQRALAVPFSKIRRQQI